jgi:hypothetical protein
MVGSQGRSQEAERLKFFDAVFNGVVIKTIDAVCPVCFSQRDRCGNNQVVVQRVRVLAHSGEPFVSIQANPFSQTDELDEQLPRDSVCRRGMSEFGARLSDRFEKGRNDRLDAARSAST